MALKSTIYKARLQVSDMDRHYYAEHALTIARHPSENEQRLMVRVLAFALFASDRLAFGRGISTDDEPALWEKNDAGDIERWIEVGLPDERALRKASGRARQVAVLAYGGRAMEAWWEKDGAAMRRLTNLRVLAVNEAVCQSLVALADRGMDLQCSIQDGEVWLGDGDQHLNVSPSQWWSSGAQ